MACTPLCLLHVGSACVSPACPACAYCAQFDQASGSQIPDAWSILRACLQINALETRSAGLAVASCMNLLFSFVISQCFLSMLCTLQVGDGTGRLAGHRQIRLLTGAEQASKPG